MGLDCCWTHPDWTNDEGELVASRVPTPDTELELVGGMLSGHGAKSFRGKVYAEFIKSATGVSLYNPELHPRTVEFVSKTLSTMHWDYARQSIVCEETQRGPQRPQTETEFNDLVTMFSFYADKGAGLIGHW